MPPEPPNNALRAVGTIAIIAAVALVGWAVVTNTGRQAHTTATPTSGTPTAGQAAPAAGTPAATTTPSTTPAATPTVTTPSGATPSAVTPTPGSTTAAAAQPTPAPAGVASIPPLKGLRAEPWPAAEKATDFDPIGTLDRASTASAARAAPQMQVQFSPNGAGVRSLTLANHTVLLSPKSDREVLQTEIKSTISGFDPAANRAVNFERHLVPFMLLRVVINDQPVTLAAGPEARLWRQLAPGKFEAQIVDEQGAPIARVTREFTLPPGRYDLQLIQRLDNLSAQPLTIQWVQLGPVDLPQGPITYGGDPRRSHLGFLPPLSINPDHQVVQADSVYLSAHAALLGSPTFGSVTTTEFTPQPTQVTANRNVWPENVLWPNKASIKSGHELAWAALNNRFFTVAMHPLPERQPRRTDTATKGVPDKRFNLVGQLDRIVLDQGEASSRDAIANAKAAFRIASRPTAVAPGGSFDASIGIYAGPISPKYLAVDEGLRQMGLTELVVFVFPGPCTFCTFQSVAQLLRWYLGLLHDYIVFDWAIAIILLVVTVRTILHPVTRWSQKNITRFGKQMAAVGPKIQKLKEKYGNDPAKFREEQMKLMREEKINYAGALGCLPMFLQMPVWIALYAMIFFTFELRHEGAFFGIFQALSGGGWGFLGDLSAPDHFINFNLGLHIPLISTLMGPIDGINLLPLLLGVVFYIQTKYMSPPQAATLSPEQEMQQKMMKVMMVVMFPVFMYNAPAALAIYFITNSILGILESKWIRAMVDREDAEREAMAKLSPSTPASRRNSVEPPQRPGFFERIRIALEEKQRQLDKQRADKLRTEQGKAPRQR